MTVEVAHQQCPDAYYISFLDYNPDVWPVRWLSRDELIQIYHR